MRVVFLTPGTGNFHCGSCLRDHDLVRGLRRLGHDALMAPLYLPHVLDHDAGPDAFHPVLLGGISTCLHHAAGLFRRLPAWADRVLDHPRLLHWAARRAGMTSARSLGSLTLGMLRGESGTQRKQLARLVTWLRQLQDAAGPIDAVVLSNTLLVGAARTLRDALQLPIICTLQGEDTFLDALPPPYRDLCWAEIGPRCDDVELFTAVSEHHARIMRQRLALAESRVRAIHNGMELSDYVVARKPDPPTVGYLARMCEAKGLPRLVEAFITLIRRGHVPASTRLLVVGAMTPSDQSLMREMQQKLDTAKLGVAYEFRPNVSRAEKIALLSQMSVLSVPATYGESFGLYVLEALAAGVPVVQPRSGAFPEVLQLTGGGVLVEPDDTEALANGIESLLLDPARATALGREGQRRVFDHFTADRMAADFEAVLMALQSPATPAPVGGPA